MNKYVAGGIVLVLIAAGIWWNSTRNSEQDTGNTQDNNQQEQQQNGNNGGNNNQNGQSNQNGSTSPTPPDDHPGMEHEGNTLEGTLRTSNNGARGNLMLVMSDRTIYIFTSRDFSSLIGKEVVVTYDGTMEDFRLGDITERQ